MTKAPAQSRNPSQSIQRRLRRAVDCQFEPLERRRFLSGTPINVQITADPGVQQQPSVAVDPHAPQHVAIAYMDRALANTGYAGLGVSTSLDGGKTWQKSSIPLPAGFELSAADPMLKFDDKGHLFVSFMATTFLGEKPPINNPTGNNPESGQRWRADGFTATNGIFLARSDDAGLTWNPPVPIASHTYDGKTPVPYDLMPDLAIDTIRSSPNYGNIYVLWIRFYPAGQFPGEPDASGGSQMHIAVSSDNGASFQSRPIIIDSGNSGKGKSQGQGNVTWLRVAVGAAGEVYVSNYDFGNFVVVHSTDAAKTFDSTDPGTLTRNEHVLFGSFGTAADPIAYGKPPQLTPNGFRTSPSRMVFADPVHPGVVYAADFIATFNSAGDVIDSDILLGRSDDKTLHFTPLNNNGELRAVNDDNFGRTITGADSDVLARQYITRFTTNERGDIVGIWYDTRRDPAAQNFLDVYGAISTDGGKTFGPNFRLTENSFNILAGKFTDARADDNYYLGDFLGLSVVGDTAYAAWADTRNGNQDVYFSTFSIGDPPAPDNDRFEPNDEPSTARDLGSLLRRVVPKLHIGANDIDVFSFETFATGTLNIHAMQSRNGERLTFQLLDGAGAGLIATSTPLRNKAGTIVGQRITVPSKSSQHFKLRVSSANKMSTGYSLTIQAATATIGAVARHSVSGALAAGDQDYFLASAAASGSMHVRIKLGDAIEGKLLLDVLDPKTLDVLATGTTKNLATLTVSKGQAFVVRVSGDSANAAGSFSIELTNLDSFATVDRAGLVFPAGDGPSQIASGDLNGDGKDDLAVTNGFTDTVSVLLSNGDGTFQAPRQFRVGAFRAGFFGALLPVFRRDLVLGDFNHDHKLDVAVTNLNSADVSVLLGQGDGTLSPQRRFDAATLPFAITSGDLNNDGNLDLVVVDQSPKGMQIALLLGRGDGTFQHQIILPTGQPSGIGSVNASIQVADLNRDGIADLVYTLANDEQTYIRLGKGGMTFAKASSFSGGGPGLAVADLNGDDILDVVSGAYDTNKIVYALGTGNGKFQKPQSINSGQSTVAVAVADLASLNEDGSFGPPDGVLDIISVSSGAPQAGAQGPPAISVSSGFKDNGDIGFNDALPFVLARQPLGFTFGDFNADGQSEIAFADLEGVGVISGKQSEFPENNTSDTARDLGTVVHLAQPTLTIVPGHEDAWYSMIIPTEAIRGSGDEVIDIAAQLEHQRGAGLSMEVLDAKGKVIGSGEHLRIAASQGSELMIHVFGKTDSYGAAGSGAYTLDVTVLPQLVSIEAQPLVPASDGQVGGATASLVLGFQGDRLDPDVAEDPANYSVTWLGSDGVVGGGDDQAILIGAGDAQAVVYNSSANVDVLSGITYPTAVRQTVTLLFKDALPAGSYRVVVSPKVSAAPFNQSEMLASLHPLVTLEKTQIVPGADAIAQGAVSAAGDVLSFASFAKGTPFLSQLHADLGALLDQQLSEGEETKVTQELLAQMRARFSGALSDSTTSLLALFIDPTGLDIADPSGQHARYDLTTGKFGNTISNAYLAVASNVEVAVIPALSGTFHLNVSDVPATARGGAVIFDADGVRTISFTDKLRNEVRTFAIDVAGGGSNATAVGSLPAPRATETLDFTTGGVTSNLTTLLVSDHIASASTTAHATVQANVNNSILATSALNQKANAPRHPPPPWWTTFLEFFSTLGKRVRGYLAPAAQTPEQREKKASDEQPVTPKRNDASSPTQQDSDQPPSSNRRPAAPVPDSPRAIPADEVAKPAADTSEHHHEQTKRSSKALVGTVALASLFQSARVVSYTSRRRRRRRKPHHARRHSVKGGTT